MIDPIEIPRPPFWTPSRFCSVLILAAEVRLASMFVGTQQFDPKVATYVLAPSLIGMLCIWFPAQLSRLKEYVGLEQVVGSDEHSELVYYAGWIVLFLPFLLWMLANLSAAG